MNAVPSTGGICHLVPQTRSWCPRSPPESPAQAGGAARRDCRGFLLHSPTWGIPGWVPHPTYVPLPLGTLGWGWDRAGHGPAGPCEPPTGVPVVLAGTWGYMGSATRVPQLPLTPLCFDALQSPAEPSGLEPTAPLGGRPWGPSAPPLSCYRGRARHRGAPCPGHEGHLPGSLTAPEAAAAPLAPHALRPRGRLSPGAPGRPPTPGGHGRRARAVPAGPAGRAL